MKNSRLRPLLPCLVLLIICSSFSSVEHGVFAKLSGNKKLVIQIVPDKTYSNVVVHVNFYAANNKRVGQKAFNLSDKDKYVRKDVVTSKEFKFSFDDVSRVTIERVNENEILGEKEGESKGGVKLNIPISNHELAPI